MNRFKTEEALKRRDARAGLFDIGLKRLDLDEAIEAEIKELATSIHIKNYPEEYDLNYDDNVDSARRRKGENPMSEEYINRVNLKRKNEGVTALSSAGMSVNDDTWKIAYTEAEAVVRGRN